MSAQAKGPVSGLTVDKLKAIGDEMRPHWKDQWEAAMQGPASRARAFSHARAWTDDNKRQGRDGDVYRHIEEAFEDGVEHGIDKGFWVGVTVGLVFGFLLGMLVAGVVS